MQTSALSHFFGAQIGVPLVVRVAPQITHAGPIPALLGNDRRLDDLWHKRSEPSKVWDHARGSRRTDFGAILPQAFYQFTNDLLDQQNAKFFARKNLCEKLAQGFERFDELVDHPSR